MTEGSTTRAGNPQSQGITGINGAFKRALDICISATALVGLGWLILIGFVIASLDTGQNGFFLQRRIGRHGLPFNIIKLRTMKDQLGVETTVTTADDSRITRIGRIMRAAKIDELPQLINVLVGQMSLVGPRPDVPGFADKLTGDDRIVLSVRPGITGPASIKYRNEEKLLAGSRDPEQYNRVIFADKVRINREYIENYRFWLDVKYMWYSCCKPRKSFQCLPARRDD